jgi:hypothetical protein
MFATLKDRLGCLGVRKLTAARRGIIRESDVGSTEQNPRFRGTCRRKLRRETPLFSLELLSSKSGLKGQGPTSCRVDGLRKRLAKHIAIMCKTHASRQLGRILTAIGEHYELAL